MRLLNSALGGQAGWLLGFAVVAGLALLIQTRLKRSEPRTGWLVAVGGSFVITAAVFSEAKGIFHPYYVSLLAPFTAALVGAFVGVAGATIGMRSWMRAAAVAAIVAGVAGELAVLHDYPGQLSWLAFSLAPVGVIAALVVLLMRGRTQHLALAIAFGGLLLGPAIWAFDTLGHATSGTFPAGGPVSAQTAGGPPGGPGGGRPSGPRRGAGIGPSGSPGGQPQPLFGGGGRSGPPPGAALPGAASLGVGARLGLGGASGGPGAGAAVGAPLGGGAAGEQALDQAISYAKRHGGGTIAVASQSTAATAIVQQDANVAGIGGFSGRESDISVSWLAMEVRLGHVRWVLSEGSDLTSPRLPGDNRTGANTALAAVRHSCARVGLSPSGGGVGSEETLYDCSGHAEALQRAGRVAA